MINIDKVSKTRDGQEVLEIFHYPYNCKEGVILAHVLDDDYQVECHQYYASGRYWEDGMTGMDLIEDKEEEQETEHNKYIYESIETCYRSLGAILEDKERTHT